MNTNDKLYIEWWNNLPMYDMDFICKRVLSYRYYDKEPEGLTDEEIQYIHKLEFIK